MNGLFLFLFLVSIACLLTGLIQPKVFSRFFRDKTNRKFIGLVFGITTILFLILFGITFGMPSSNKSENSSIKVDQAPQYEFVKTKTETADGNKMDLYAYSGSLNLDTLKTLCKENKQKFTSGKFYYLVVFDSKENAVFPQDPFTAEFGIEEVPQKHIRAIYIYNRINGYSNLDYYDTNKLEGTAKTEEI